MAVKQTTENETGAGIARGLEGVVICQSKLCQIDGQEGRLYYAGYAIEDLARESTFEETAFLLWNGRLPKTAELEALKAAFRAKRALSKEALDFLASLPRQAHPMDALRTAVSFLGCAERASDGGEYDRALSITAKIPAILAGFQRLRRGQPPIAPHPTLDHAANFLYMVHGKEPSAAEARVMDMALVLHADHEMNASTFSALVTASTKSDLYSSVVSGIGTLKGSLHGGANEEVLNTLKEIGDAANVETFVDEGRKTKRRIMGFGHRVYKAYDPRARILKEEARALSKGTDFERFFAINEKLENVMKDRFGEKGIFPNVDLYSGIVYHQMGIETDLFTPIFAMSRVAGWTAHVIEYWQDNRLFRPNADYTGPAPRAYAPASKR